MNLYRPTTTMQPRPYQVDALDALDAHLASKPTNPCIVLPTGAGKSPVMAWAIERWKREYPPFRCIVLAHVKELVAQNADKMHAIWPDGDVGVYSAGLGRRDMRHAITFASIDSVYSRGGEFEPFDVVIVDEAHRIPVSGEGKYRKFLTMTRLANRDLRVVGFTATPYRMSSGPICHRDHILHEVAYQANLRALIDDGYLCPLRSKLGQAQPDLADVHVRGGEYVPAELASAVDKESIVRDAVAEALRLLDAEHRQSAIWFAVSVEHCQHVADNIRRHGQAVQVITGQTHHYERDQIAAAFKRGSVRHVVNVNVLTEGFDATRTDAIVLLRPTKSRGLYTQMVGRGLRLDPSKSDCLVLDFAGCIDAHGPLDLMEAGEVRTHVCGECAEVFSRALGKCPACGTAIPKRVIDEAIEREAAERRLHGTKAHQADILSNNTPETHAVTDVHVRRHVKQGSPDSLRVTYQIGLHQATEWVCLDHPGYAAHKAAIWWRRRFGDPIPTVNGALEDLFLAAKLAELTETITVRRDGKYLDIVAVNVRQPAEVRTA